MTAEKEVSSAEAFMRLEARLASVEDAMVRLREVFIEPGERAVPKGHRQVVFKGSKESAHQMRVSKAAKRNGMSREAWVAQYGEREHNPPAGGDE